MIGKPAKIFSNGWKNRAEFSNHWKKVFQSLETFSGRRQTVAGRREAAEGGRIMMG
jgi:hypothetical protein